MNSSFALKREARMAQTATCAEGWVPNHARDEMNSAKPLCRPTVRHSQHRRSGLYYAIRKSRKLRSRFTDDWLAEGEE